MRRYTITDDPQATVVQQRALTVYGVPESELPSLVPEGWEMVEYRCPEPDEWFLTAKARSIIRNHHDWIAKDGPRLILRSKPDPPKRRRRVFEETGEERALRKGDWYEDSCGDMMQMEGRGTWVCPIWREITEEQS